MPGFYQGKRVLVTGHTGFKGSWLCRALLLAGAQVTGYALEPSTRPSLWGLLNMGRDMPSVTGDIRDLPTLSRCYREARPEIVLHLAAQPIVREGYRDPAGTYSVNVMGTVNLLECVRALGGARSVLNITTDKVYRNNEWAWGYRESDDLDGRDPYSNSKSCSELITGCYKASFLDAACIPVSTARSGNVIGGGDFAPDRILPDCVRAAEHAQAIVVRNPYSVRPYQHVLEALGAYLLIARRQYEDRSVAGCYNVGPGDEGCVTTGDLADLFCKAWGGGQKWENRHDGGPREAGFLRLDCSRIRSALGWHPCWNIQTGVEQTVRWEKARLSGGGILAETDRQIGLYFSGASALGDQ